MEWYIYRNGEQVGPISEEEFRGMLQNNEVAANDYVWNAQMSDWMQLDQAPGLPAVEATGPMAEQQGAGETGPLSVQNCGCEPTREELLTEILKYNNAGPFTIARGQKTDLVITNEVVSSNWFSGKKKISYTAQLLLNEEEKTVYYWEALKEISAGISVQIGFQKKLIKGVEMFQKARETGYAPTGAMVYDYQFDYGSLREALRGLVEEQGWKLKTVIMKGKTER